MADTVCASFIQTCERLGNKVALIHYIRDRWVEHTWRDYLEMVERAAMAFHELGVKPGTRVAIFSNTRLEWAVCDLAILGLGGITEPIYQSNTAEDDAHILLNSETQVLVCEDQKLVDCFKS